MQTVSEQYKKSMKSPLRNRGYIRVRIGAINSVAQKNARIPSNSNSFAYFSENTKVFDGQEVTKQYATCEENFSKTDGSMYFLPRKNSEYEIYYNGVVMNDPNDSLFIDFGAESGLDIKGLTIDFGHCYPVSFTLTWDNGSRTYENGKNVFETEDVFEGVSYFTISNATLVSGIGRLRIKSFMCGLVKQFSNKDVLSYSFSEYTSAVSESLPYQEMTIKVDNQDQYYNPSDPSNLIAFLEERQEVTVAFGYDVTGKRDIEWLPEHKCFLKDWDASDTDATFKACDKLQFMDGTYYGGLYYTDGKDLYSLSKEVLKNAEIEESEYYLDPFLKKAKIHNPIPAVRHCEALQMIANAGRCKLQIGRNGQIQLKSSVEPTVKATSSDLSKYGSIKHLLDDTDKTAYAIYSNDFTTVDGNNVFFPLVASENACYISESVSDRNGLFSANPTVRVEFDIIAPVYKINLKFKNTYPVKYEIRTYLQGALIERTEVKPTDVFSANERDFGEIDAIEIEFLQASPNSRISIESLIVGDSVGYFMQRNADITGSVIQTRDQRLESITVMRNKYAVDKERKSIANDKVSVIGKIHDEYICLTNPATNYSVAIISGNATAKIIKSTAYMVQIQITKQTAAEEEIEYEVTANEYIVTSTPETRDYKKYGRGLTYDNPLVNSKSMAPVLIDWMEKNYAERVDYDIPWRGDPRIDAGDLINLELKNGSVVKVRVEENNLDFNGAWSGTVKGKGVR